MEELWSQVLADLRESIKPVFFNKFIGPIRLVTAGAREFVLELPDELTRNHVRDRYLGDINRLLTQYYGAPLEARLILKGSHLEPARAPEYSPGQMHLNYRQQPPEKSNPAVGLNFQPNPKFTLNTFVCGPNNQLAYEAGLALLDNPGVVYNPLYIYGSPGLGKTHLIHALANEFLKRQPWLKITIMQLEVFQSLWVKAVRNGQSESFKAKIRSSDVFIIDDIHSLGGNATSTQEELFNTFNHLYGLNKQILFTSDRTPGELQIEDRLRSRFAWGLTAKLVVPPFETRQAIVSAKAENLKLKLPADVVDFLARRVTSNIRFLEAAVNKLDAYSRLLHRPVDLPLAMEITSTIVRQEQDESRFQVEKILEMVSKYTGINEFEILGKSRSKKIARARQLCMYLAGEHSDLTKKEIARKFGRQDHTTVINAEKRIRQALESDRELQIILEQILSELRAA